MVELDKCPQESNMPTLLDVDTPDSLDAELTQPTGKMTLLLVVTLIAVAVIVVLALIGPVAGGDISIVLSL
jgi:hypothetical protein